MACFTLLSEYQGSTIIEQAEGPDVGAALERWFRETETGAVRDSCDGVPTPVSGRRSVWCHCCADAEGVFILTHIVETNASGER